MSKKLRACPFCGLKTARVERVDLRIRFAHTVRCACGAKVANYDTRRAAVDAWNGCMLHPMAREARCTALINSAKAEHCIASITREQAKRVLLFIDELCMFAAAHDKRAAAEAIARRLKPLGYSGLSLRSLNRALDDLRRNGLYSLVPAKGNPWIKRTIEQIHAANKEGK